MAGGFKDRLENLVIAGKLRDNKQKEKQKEDRTKYTDRLREDIGIKDNIELI